MSAVISNSHELTQATFRSAELGAEIEQFHQRSLNSGAESLRAVLDAGDRLQAAFDHPERKTLFPRWEDWLRQFVPNISSRTDSYYRKLASKREQIEVWIAAVLQGNEPVSLRGAISFLQESEQREKIADMPSWPDFCELLSQVGRVRQVMGDRLLFEPPAWAEGMVTGLPTVYPSIADLWQAWKADSEQWITEVAAARKISEQAQSTDSEPIAFAQVEPVGQWFDIDGTELKIGDSVMISDQVSEHREGHVAGFKNDIGMVAVRIAADTVIDFKPDDLLLWDASDWDPVNEQNSQHVAKQPINVSGEYFKDLARAREVGAIAQDAVNPKKPELYAQIEAWNANIQQPEATAVVPEVVTESDHYYNMNKTGGNGERNTPERYWKPSLQMWGLKQFDLDPMTNANSSVPATVKYTEAEDGLAQTWNVNDGKPVHMFSNPDFGLNGEFVEKLISEMQADYGFEAVIFDKIDPRTDWGQKLLEISACICLVTEYVKFEGLDKKGQPLIQSPFSVVYYYIGDRPAAFAEAHKELGITFSEFEYPKF